MAAPVLLVHDDLEVIAQLKRILAREGYELVLATSAADAVIAFGAHLPGLILLAPSVESGRGHIVLEELQQHPDGKLAKVLLLGESVPGFGYPVAPMPPGDELAQQINELINPTADDWTMREVEKTVAPPQLDEPPPPEPPAPVPPEETAGWRTSPPPEEERSLKDLEGTLFGDLEQQVGQEIEAQVQSHIDPELERLENEVRAEAARRRQAREPATTPPPPSIPPAAEESARFELKEHDEAPPPPEAAAAPAPSADLSSREAELEAKVREAGAKVDRARAEWAAREAAAHEAVESAEKALKAARAQADTERRTQKGELERLEREAEHADTLVRKEREQRAQVEEQLDQERDARARVEQQLATLQESFDAVKSELDRLRRQAFEAESRIKDLDDALVKAQGAHEETRSELALLSEEHEGLSKQLSDEQRRGRASSEAAAALEMRMLELQESKDQAAEVAKATSEQLIRELEHERGARATAEAHQSELLADISRLELQLKDTRKQMEAEREATSAQLKALREELDQVRAEQAAEAARAAAAETAAQRAEAHVKELEDRAILPLAPAGKPPLGLPRTGTLKLGELARMMAALVLGGAEVRVELGVSGGTRNLWLKRGQLVAAESSLPYETLSDRARRDGLIDARQEADLASVRGASAHELLAVMKQRGLIRDAEVPGLVQRYTEAVALDAFTESSCTYRLHDEQPGPEVLAAASTRTVLPMVAEALRRVLPPETQLEALGGSEAVPVATDTELDIRALGFTERERRMLSFVDGEATIEDIVLAAGMRPDKAYKVIAVARHLGLLEVKPPAARRPQPSLELDVQRLEAKFEQVQEADYFTILGLSRNAGTDEVQRAFERLSDEFDPLRFSGHPDAALQQRAAVVHRMLEEAARALEDDQRRAEYARHLLD